ncbi:MAG TPA: alpha-hydroxy-acid oxidizing enzyme, partial [Cytophagales bacterium]|nr:alpha-hydroxy-acid oxidizing enzyme [Cytophagales bacterium]
VAESGRASLDSLAEVAQAVQGQIPVMMDGGVRRGKDVFKALARGASMVGIGRPYLWGLSAFGQEGVEVVLKLLQAELKLAMQQTGVASVSEISGAHLL